MASVYMAGQTLAALVFPQMSDSVVGRKKAIVFGHFALIVPMLLFGLSRTYWEAFFWRFLNGALQANRPITNAVIADITDETNQAKAYGLGAMSWGMATMIGPSMGGLLSESPCARYRWHLGCILLKMPAISLLTGFPAETFPGVFGAEGSWGQSVPAGLAELWVDFPYLLPCVVAVGWAVMGLVATIICIPDDRDAVGWCALLTGRYDRNPDNWQRRARYEAVATEADGGEERASLLEGGGGEGSGGDDPPSPRTPRRKMKYWAMMKVYAWANTVWVIYMELLPLFGKATPCEPTHLSLVSACSV